MNPIGHTIVYLLFAFIGIFLGHDIAVDNMESTAIKHNCAQFNPQTGEFEWIEK